MIESVQFQNYRALRDTTLPLGRFTLVVGPNGSGKSTALTALGMLGNPGQKRVEDLVTAALIGDPHARVTMIVRWAKPDDKFVTRIIWDSGNRGRIIWEDTNGAKLPQSVADSAFTKLVAPLAKVRVFALDSKAIMLPAKIGPGIELNDDGAQLAAVLDGLSDGEPERFQALNEELGRWLPEFDRVLFDGQTHSGAKVLQLRTRRSHHKIRASDLSQGTLFALAILAIAYTPDCPPLICLEEPDRGIHPRLLRQVQDAMYRLSHPEGCGEQRTPVQVVATTHSPYMLDHFKDHPEEIVIAEKTDHEARFHPLSERSDIDEILQETLLGDAWYSGVLGGVPCRS